MKLLGAVCFCALVLSCSGRVKTTRDDGSIRYFPEDFIFGASTSSYQIEGAWDADGKGESIWDRLIHTDPTAAADDTNADDAANSYYQYRRDVELLRELGLDAYRFSVSWPRLLPTGFANQINQAAVNYYNNLIDEMLTYGITPFITIYHWDLPQKLQDLGGFSNPLFADWYEDYARVCFELFGDRVKYWITFNEPKQICYQGYGDTTMAPRLNATGIGEYLCAKHLIQANARAWHLYDNEFRATQNGQIGYVVEVGWYSAASDSEEDIAAAELKRQSEWGIYSDPIFAETGGWPKELEERVAEKSAEQGYPRSRLPEWTQEEKEYVLGTADFYGFNHYSSYRVSATIGLRENAVPSILDDINVGTFVPEGWTISEFNTMPQGPDNLNQVMIQLSDRYGDVDFYITESGFPASAGLQDDVRVNAYRLNLNSVLNSLDSGISVKAFMPWALMDNWSWLNGYRRRFGLYEIDFNDENKTRVARKSGFVYKDIVKKRYIDLDYEPAIDEQMTIDEGN